MQLVRLASLGLPAVLPMVLIIRARNHSAVPRAIEWLLHLSSSRLRGGGIGVGARGRGRGECSVSEWACVLGVGVGEREPPANDQFEETVC